MPGPPSWRCWSTWSGCGLAEASALPRWSKDLQGSACCDVRVQVCLVVMSFVGRFPLVYRTKLCSAAPFISPRKVRLDGNDPSDIFRREKDLSSRRFPLLFTFIAGSLVHSSVQSLSHVWLFATPWTAAPQASLSITNTWSLLKLMSISSVMPSNHLILCCPLLLLPLIFPSIRVFSSETVLPIRGLSIRASASASVLAMNIQDWFPLGWTGWISFQSKGLSRVFSNITFHKHQFFSAQLSFFLIWSFF